jgi:hypothetical protein
MKDFFHNSLIPRGHERIRTAVHGFADHCLTARPRDRFLIQGCKFNVYISYKKDFLKLLNPFFAKLVFYRSPAYYR